jgi:hypothetical protein
MAAPLLPSSELPPPPPNWDNLDVLEQHPELHHYTTLQGLQGIVATNSLWTTHYSDLNDATELMLIRAPLERELAQGFRELIRAKSNQSFKASRAVAAVGGLKRAAEDAARQMIALLYASTFTLEDGFHGVDDLKGPAFIASFCTHSAPAESYERENGLLSQWRGYGGSGGFCIVFDTPQLFELLGKEHATHAYMNLAIDPVRYLYPDTPVSEVFPQLRAMCDHMMRYLLDNKHGEPEDIFSDFIKSAIFCKHHAFHEEREVRVAVRPATEGWRAAIAGQGKWAVPPSKPIIGGDGSRRRIVLFDTLGERLPIKRVIVGPCADQQSNAEKIRALLGAEVAIRCSETPYLERNWGAGK